MNPPTLRDLSRAYALGSLDRETYRKQRHELLTRIAAGELPVLAFTAPEPEQRTVFPDDDSAGDITQEILAPMLAQQAHRPAGSGGLSVMVVVVVAVALAAGAWTWRHHQPSQPLVAQPATAAEQPALTPDPLTEFLDANQWQSTDLMALDQRWDSLDTATREQLSKAPSMRRLLDKVLEQIQAERALLSLGDGREALASQQQLLDLMAHLGVQDPRLQRGRATW
jgi:uncharacterized protein HemX